MGEEFDWMLFIGRFHPLVVHLPLGFLRLAALMEILAKRLGAYLSKAAGIAWLAGAISALLAVILGFLLASDGSYQGNTLLWHQWMGIGVAVLAWLCWLLKFKENASKAYYAVIVVLLLSLVVTGHLGGNLTHGEHYLLEYAPTPIRKITGFDHPQTSEIPAFTDPDSIPIFEALVRPILQQKCVSCHNQDKQKGGLMLTSWEEIALGGENGAVILSGQPEESELFKRVTLDPQNVKFMPPKGVPLSYDEIRVLKWWISTGASFTDKIGNVEKNEEVVVALQRSRQLDISSKSFLETLEVEPPGEELLEALLMGGFMVNSLSSQNPLLEVTFSHDSISAQQWEQLLMAKEQIVYLDLSHSGIQDSDLATVAQMENLVRLKLNHTMITDRGVEMLKSLKHLESLNLYATHISGQGLHSLQEIRSLKNLFLWQTEVKPGEITNLLNARPDIRVDTGFTFAPVAANPKIKIDEK